ncbi:MAG: hypothetical protein AB1648_00270 [Pseudomonadota bacterium]|jgi:hypothetical protein
MIELNNAVSLLVTFALIAAVGFEINRRQKQLRQIYDVLDSESKHITAQLEKMVQEGTLQPYVERA